MKLEETKKRILEILKSENRFGWKTREIAEKLGYKDSSWVLYCCHLLQKERKIIDISDTQNKFWRIKDDGGF